MTEKEVEQIASAVAEKIKNQPHICQVFTTEEIYWFHGCFDFCKRSRITALATLVGFVVLGLLGLLTYGFIHKLKFG